MRTDTPIATRLKDYKPAAFHIDSVYLEFDLQPQRTRVRSKLVMRRSGKGAEPLVLDGENLLLKQISVDGKALPSSVYRLTDKTLTISELPDSFDLEIETVINPADNKALMGLYVSGGRFCTQCEAEGFRRITYYLDRPDVMSVFTVKIIADKNQYPTLLANGNRIDSGELADGRHFAVWYDPFKKPCYLFALVAGKFDRISDTFTTMSGRVIPLDIFVDEGDAPRAAYAMDALKRSMTWDEEAFGREYDLDRFMIVAVRDFNFGAMENKGLNIFNSSLLLADEASATDMNFELIESVVAHEYFHNWTGNRITCRDWFQLCLKEGFTVFRDQEFSASQRGAAVQRIKDVKALRARQFPEDAGPLAHPVRPQSYVKIDNFYTATIYEKGAELIRMLKAILGDDEFRKGCDYYFDTLDGTAATVEQFLSCFEHTSGQDLSQFMLWYQQAGTPNIKIEKRYRDDTRTLTLVISQSTPPTPGQKQKRPVPIPVKLSLLDQEGRETHHKTIVLEKERETHQFKGVSRKTLVSALQSFSAPVTLDMDESSAETVLRMQSDPDLFNRWEAGQALGLDILCEFSKYIELGEYRGTQPHTRAYIRALGSILTDDKISDTLKALALTPPADGAVLQVRTRDGGVADPLAIHEAGNWLKRAIAEIHKNTIIDLYTALSEPVAFKPDAEGAGRRSLRNVCLALLAHNPSVMWRELALSQFETATNMTEELAALLVIARRGGKSAMAVLSRFYDKWQANPLVVDKWFAASATLPGDAGFKHVQNLLEHPAYKGANPNRVRSLVGGFAAGNANNFHRIDGRGYAFYADNIIEIDKSNPMVAARLSGAFGIWRKLDGKRQNLVKAQLERILGASPSDNVREIATKSLEA